MTKPFLKALRLKYFSIKTCLDWYWVEVVSAFCQSLSFSDAV